MYDSYDAPRYVPSTVEPVRQADEDGVESDPAVVEEVEEEEFVVEEEEEEEEEEEATLSESFKWGFHLSRKFLVLTQKQLSLLTASIVSNQFSEETMIGFDETVLKAHRALRNSFAKEFGHDKIQATRLYNISQKHPLTTGFARLREWLTVIPLVSQDVTRSLNLCTSSFAQALYNSQRKDEKLKEALNQTVDQKWYLSYRNCSYMFPVAYGSSTNSYETRFTARSIGNNAVWSTSFKGFKEKVATRLFTQEFQLQEYCLLSLDMVMCHSRIAASILGLQSPELASMLKEDDIWGKVTQAVPGAHDFTRLKAVIKRLFYKALNGGNIRSDLADHEALRVLAKKAGKPAEQLGLEIIETTSVLKELELFRKKVSHCEAVYPLSSRAPFRYAKPSKKVQKKSSRALGSKPLTPDTQERSFQELPPGVVRASAPQKVSRVLTGIEVVLLAIVVRSVIMQDFPAIPVSLEHDGVQILTKKSNIDQVLASAQNDLSAFSQDLLGLEMPLSASILPQTTF